MTVDNAAILQIVGNCAAIFASACAPVIAVYLAQLVGLKKDGNAQAMLTTAINRAAGVAIDATEKHGVPLLAAIEKSSPAFAAGMQYIQDTAGPQATRLNVDEIALANKLSSQLALTLKVPMVQAATVAPQTKA